MSYGEFVTMEEFKSRSVKSLLDERMVGKAVKKRAEEARKAAAFEAENRRAKEAAEKEVTENAKKASEETQKREAVQTLEDVNRSEPGSSGSNILPSAGTLDVRDFSGFVSAVYFGPVLSALNFSIYQQPSAFYQSILRSNSFRELESCSLVRAADSALRVEVERIQKFKEVDENNQALRLSHNQVPLAMDLLLAELHKACIYTNPKHVAYSESATSKEDYFKVMGFREEDGKAESRDSYLEGMASYVKLYGALVQVDEVSGVQNLHGLKEGWAWIARLLNSLPTNIYTAVALNSFLE
ncbi:hypothetical protein C5167_002849, partial [Papaver somniferum]